MCLLWYISCSLCVVLYYHSHCLRLLFSLLNIRTSSMPPAVFVHPPCLLRYSYTFMPSGTLVIFRTQNRLCLIDVIGHRTVPCPAPVLSISPNPWNGPAYGHRQGIGGVIRLRRSSIQQHLTICCTCSLMPVRSPQPLVSPERGIYRQRGAEPCRGQDRNPPAMSRR